ncbi:phage holin family protein [Nocardioides sp.]|uniref:phage holin family protein n=1 Tax=Nocardioides sp. TaxID=35761 RepID=UPI0027341251|nr:phage holin family protein [Nocardioides sp.]MDP3890759.1 phage holin family protein [Nocardioides sp.]
MRFVSWLLTTALALSIAAWLLDGIAFEGSSGTFTEQVQDKWLDVLLVALILGVITSFVKPIVQFLSLPFIILTIGLFLLVINALMLMLTAWIAGEVGIGFEVDGFWTAVVGSIIITIVTWAVDLVVDRD